VSPQQIAAVELSLIVMSCRFAQFLLM